MPSYAFERLSAQENRFLLLESPETPMHATSVAIYRAGPLATPGGGVDIARFKHFIESLLHQVPRYRQKLKTVPIENHPVWIDDPHFNLDFHVRHAALPRPGTIEELKKKVARIMVQPLDRARPLWETWVIEQIEDPGCSFESYAEIPERAVAVRGAGEHAGERRQQHARSFLGCFERVQREDRAVPRADQPAFHAVPGPVSRNGARHEPVAECRQSVSCEDALEDRSRRLVFLREVVAEQNRDRRAEAGGVERRQIWRPLLGTK